jgi:hypothetical protein
MRDGSPVLFAGYAVLLFAVAPPQRRPALLCSAAGVGFSPKRGLPFRNVPSRQGPTGLRLPNPVGYRITRFSAACSNHKVSEVLGPQLRVMDSVARLHSRANSMVSFLAEHRPKGGMTRHGVSLKALLSATTGCGGPVGFSGTTTPSFPIHFPLTPSQARPRTQSSGTERKAKWSVRSRSARSRRTPASARSFERR